MSFNPLPEKFRKLDFEQRRNLIRSAYAPEEEEWRAISADPDLDSISDIMVESAIGSVPIPLGIASGFLIDGQEVNIPMAVEEPSVIAAASFAAKIIRRGGGLSTWAEDSVMTAQIFLEDAPEGAESRLRQSEGSLAALVDSAQPAMKARGGGYRGIELTRLPESGVVVVGLRIDVRDAMGANALNTAAETLKPELERLSGGKALMCILSNAARQRRAGARFALPVSRLAALGPQGMNGQEVARRIVLASRIAQEDEQRAITHNKGIMNGISALVLATMNDTRAVEAAAHAWAGRSGRYRSLSSFAVEEQKLIGAIELPLAVGSLGGAVNFHPASRLALRILGFPGAQRLSRIAAALGLSQNFAAVLALVTGGIQRGHMKYHAARLAFSAGARGEEVRKVADALAEGSSNRMEEAQRLLEQLRREKDG